MNLEPYRTALSELPFTAKLMLFGAVVALVVVVGAGVGAGVSSWKERAYEAQERKRAAERDALAIDRDAALRRAEAAEAQIPLLRQDIKDRDALIAKASAKIQQADAARQAAVEEYEAEQDTLSLPVDPAERRRRACSRLAALGFPCQ